MPFQVPSDIIFLVRCVAILSGMCTGLNPEFNVWEGLTPFAEKLIAEEVGGNWQLWLGEIGNWGKSLVSLPIRLENTLNKVDRGDLAVRTPQLNAQLWRIERAARRLIWTIIFAVLLLGGIQLYLASEFTFAVILLIVSFLTFLAILFSPRRS
jgi:predicted unusual protein kinase regulating ubiquinone biosynthesis (AarF/ABC1/UbiB family)